MAGSYSHIVQKDGNLASSERIMQTLDNAGDVFETIEEMYGMIWYLAGKHYSDQAKAMVVDARNNYGTGLILAKDINK